MPSTFTCSRSGMSILNVIMLLMLIGVLVIAGASLVGPLVKRGKVNDTKTTITSNVDAIISWSVTNGKIPSDTEYTAVLPNPNDAWGRSLVYAYDADLANPSQGGLCGRTSVTYNPIAFVIVSGGDDFSTESTPNSSQAFTAAPDLKTSDLYRVVTLDELKNRAGCAGSTQGRLRILNNELPNACTNQPYALTQLYGEGGVGARSFTTTASIPGLTVSGSSINGTPTTAGSYPVTVTLTDDLPQSIQRTLPLNVYQTPTCTVSATPASITAGQTTTLSWSISAGGQVSGTWSPSPGGTCVNFINYANGSYSCSTGPITSSTTFQLTLKNSRCTDSCSASVSTGACPTLVITSASPLPQATAYSPYSTTLAASGTMTPAVWGVSAGSLPAGLTLNSASGIISGTPTTPGLYSFTISLSDACVPARSISKVFTLRVICTSYQVWNHTGAQHDFRVAGTCRNNVNNGAEITSTPSVLLTAGSSITRYTKQGNCKADWAISTSVAYADAVLLDTNGDCRVNYNANDMLSDR